MDLDDLDAETAEDIGTFQVGLGASTSDGREPRWSRDGRQMYFRGLDDAAMYSESVRLEPTFEAARPELPFSRLLFADPVRQQTYDIAPDGRFLMAESVEQTDRDRVIVVLHFDEELKQLLPARYEGLQVPVSARARSSF